MKKCVILAICLISLIGVPSICESKQQSIDSPTAPTSSRQSIVSDRDEFGRKIVDLIIKPAYYAKFSAPICNISPQYYCNGIMLSVFEYDDMYWTNSSPPYGKFSMTYFQHDTTWEGGKPIYWADGGYMLWPQAVLQAYGIGPEDVFTPVYGCIFPVDGGTDGRSDNGCGEIHNAPSTASCQSLSITDAKSWLNAYYKYSYGTGVICSFSLNSSLKDSINVFSTVKEIQIYLNQEHATDPKWNIHMGAWDEVIQKPWDSYAPSKIPLLAFFYVPSGPPAGDRVKNDNPAPVNNPVDVKFMQAQQLNYYNITGIFVPIIQISGASWDNIQFDYLSSQQAPEIPNSVHVLAPVVSSGHPVANFGIGLQGLTIDFTNASRDTNGMITSYAWYFGDGSYSAALNPSHTYATSGPYVVSLTATDNTGATNTTTVRISIPSNSSLMLSPFGGSILQ